LHAHEQARNWNNVAVDPSSARSRLAKKAFSLPPLPPPPPPALAFVPGLAGTRGLNPESPNFSKEREECVSGPDLRSGWGGGWGAVGGA